MELLFLEPESFSMYVRFCPLKDVVVISAVSGPVMMSGNLSPDHHRPSLLSRSAEDIFSPILGTAASTKKKTKEKKGTWGSISRVFSRSKRRKALDPELFESECKSVRIFSPQKLPICHSELKMRYL